jgi:hypothetical protein
LERRQRLAEPRFARPASDEDQANAAMVIFVRCFGIAEEGLDFDPGLFAALAHGSLFGRFAGFDLSAGKFPQPGQGNVRRTPANQKAIFALNHSDGNGSDHAIEIKDC